MILSRRPSRLVAHRQAFLLVGAAVLFSSAPAHAFEAEQWRGHVVVTEIHWQIVIRQAAPLQVADASPAVVPPPPPIPSEADELSPQGKRIQWLRRIQRMEAENQDRMRMSREERTRLRIDIREAGYQVYIPGNGPEHGKSSGLQAPPNPPRGPGGR